MRRATALIREMMESIVRIPVLGRNCPISVLMLRLSAVENSTCRLCELARLSRCAMGGRNFTLVTLLVLLRTATLMVLRDSPFRCSRLLRCFG